MKFLMRSYFKEMASAKKTHWSDFLSMATPYSIWTAKRVAIGRPLQRFPNLLNAHSSEVVAETLLAHFFPRGLHPPLASV